MFFLVQIVIISWPAAVIRLSHDMILKNSVKIQWSWSYYITSMFDDAIIIVAGDFNQLNTSCLSDFGLVQMINSQTHLWSSNWQIFWVALYEIYMFSIL